MLKMDRYETLPTNVNLLCIHQKSHSFHSSAYFPRGQQKKRGECDVSHWILRLEECTPSLGLH